MPSEKKKKMRKNKFLQCFCLFLLLPKFTEFPDTHELFLIIFLIISPDNFS